MNAFGTVFALVELYLTPVCNEKRAACATARLLLSNLQFQNSGFKTYIFKPTLSILVFNNTQLRLINLQRQLVTQPSNSAQTQQRIL